MAAASGDDVAVLKCRNLAHRIDRKKFGRAVVTFVQAEQMNVIRFADFLSIHRVIEGATGA
jgi:hypothetical protein